MVKRIKQNDKISFALFALKFKYFNFCEILTAKPIRLSPWDTWTFHEDQEFLQNGRPTALSGLREERLQYILKTIIELETSLSLRQFFAAALKKWRLTFIPRYFSPTKNSVSDNRNVWMEIRLNSLQSLKQVKRKTPEILHFRLLLVLQHCVWRHIWVKMRLKSYKMAMSISPKFLTSKWNISRTIWRIEVNDGSFFAFLTLLHLSLIFLPTGGSL